MGAGLAGLVVAHRLVQRGHDVLVIEATARAGGRIRTIRGWPDRLHVEAGATHVLADPELVKLLVELGVASGPPFPRVPKKQVVFADGERRVYEPGEDVPSPLRYTNEERRLGFLGRGDSVAWQNEPFARGAYAAFRPRQLTELLPAAIAPEGAIHFAGCGTSYRPGFMHGASASALRVLDEIA